MTETTETDPPRWSLIQFALLCFYSMGFSGITSIPYYIHEHTGLFLVAFYLIGILVCIPICYVQLKLGALYKRGMYGIFSHLVPILKGVAIALLLMTYIRSLTHGLEMSYGLYFMFASFKQPFPWSNPIKPNTTVTDMIVIYAHANHEDEYFINNFLQRSEHIGSFGPVVWYIMLCVLFTWVVIYLFVFRGPKGIGRILYVLTPLTVVCLIAITCYAYVAVPNAWSALYRLFSGATSRFNHVTNRFKDEDIISTQLGNPKLWIHALDVHLFSLGLWAGILPTLGTHIHNKKIIINAAWAILLILYSVLPHLVLISIAPYIDPFRQNSGKLENSKGVKPGLAFLFVTVPHTFEQLKLSPFFAFLIFFTYFLLGVHHLGLHTLMIWENLLPCINKKVMMFFKRPDFLLALFCFLSFILTLPYSSQCGIYLYMIIRFYMDRLLFALVIFSMVPFIIGYIRQETLRLPIERLAMSMWYGLASLVSACLLIYYFAVYVYQEAVVAYDQRWAEYLGWLACISPIIFVILGAAHAVWNQTGTLQDRFLQSIRAGQLPDDLTNDDYTSVETGDTSLPHAKSPLPSDHRVHQDPLMGTSEDQQAKSEVEVSIRPPENGDVARV